MTDRAKERQPKAEISTNEALLDEITAPSLEDQALLRDLRKARLTKRRAILRPITLGERTADRITPSSVQAFHHYPIRPLVAR
jgi:hypothetical protein